MERHKKILFFYITAISVGLITGILGSYFQLAIQNLTYYLHNLLRFGISHGISGYFISTLSTLTLALFAWFLVKHIAPDAAGSGVPQIEGALLHQNKIRWRKLLPVKFIGGICAISSGLALGREGPTIQIGGNIGQMLGEYWQFNTKRCDALVAAGAAAGLATAFNAPLAGILFVMEEMRHAFSLPFLHFKTVALSCIAATIISQYILGGKPAIEMDIFFTPHLDSLSIFFIFGLAMGFLGIAFNRSLIKMLTWTQKQNARFRFGYILLIGLIIGGLSQMYPEAIGGGYEIIKQTLHITPNLDGLFVLFIMRFLMTLLSYNTGVPGGIFAPLLALGTIAGLIAFSILHLVLPASTIEPGMLAVAGMGALFSATIRAPVTGIVLVVEMTQNYALILPLMVSSLTATTIVQLAGVSPIYTQLLRLNASKNMLN